MACCCGNDDGLGNPFCLLLVKPADAAIPADDGVLAVEFLALANSVMLNPRSRFVADEPDRLVTSETTAIGVILRRYADTQALRRAQWELALAATKPCWPQTTAVALSAASPPPPPMGSTPKRCIRPENFLSGRWPR